MITITNWNQLQSLDGRIDESLKEEMEKHFKELVTQMLEEDYLIHDIGYIGPIVIMDEDDNPNHLAGNGLPVNPLNIMEFIPEYIETLEISSHRYYRIVILFGGDTGIVIYADAETIKEEMKPWIERWKEEENNG